MINDQWYFSMYFLHHFCYLFFWIKLIYENDISCTRLIVSRSQSTNMKMRSGIKEHFISFIYFLIVCLCLVVCRVRCTTHSAAEAAGADVLTIAGTVSPTPIFDVFAKIHGCCMTVFRCIRRSGFDTNNFDIKCAAAFDRKSGAL